MKTKLSEGDRAALLARRIDGGSPRATPSRTEPNEWFAGLRGRVLGLVMGIPLGVSIYYVSLLFYYPLLYVFSTLLWITPRNPHALIDAIVFQVNFGPGCALALSVLCVTLDLLWTRHAVSHGLRAFALAKAPLSIVTVLTLFMITAIRHKPLLPFYGQ